MSQESTKIGIVGCGNISGAYLKIAPTFDNLEVAACADIIPERARARAEEFGVPRACTVEELLADPDIRIVVNLTIPMAHAEVGMAVLEAGKSLYNEKPLAITREEAQGMLRLAREKGVLIGGAPDTFLGGGHQTCRKLIDDGWIGEPVAAAGFMLGHGHTFNLAAAHSHRRDAPRSSSLPRPACQLSRRPVVPLLAACSQHLPASRERCSCSRHQLRQCPALGDGHRRSRKRR